MLPALLITFGLFDGAEPQEENLVRNWMPMGRRRKRRHIDSKRIIDTSTAETILNTVKESVERQDSDEVFRELSIKIARGMAADSRMLARFYEDLLASNRAAALREAAISGVLSEEDLKVIILLLEIL